jgi:uncharacterized protein YjbI with pentapeptide repeats
MTVLTKFAVKSRWPKRPLFTAEIACPDSAPESVRLGLAVVWGHQNGANLWDADLWGANLAGADLRDANLRDASLRDASLVGADLRGADLWGANLAGADLRDANLRDANLGGANLNGAHGLNDWIKCLQIETYPICYTAEVMQIGCESHTLDEWREFDDERIIRMDGKRALQFWRKYKDWIFQTIELCPALPTGGE